MGIIVFAMFLGFIKAKVIKDPNKKDKTIEEGCNNWYNVIVSGCVFYRQGQRSYETCHRRVCKDIIRQIRRNYYAT
jgi:hypothetical protein|nr:MAG TPA: hypothetical protein [Bacteriophage sp.]